ncbi:DUF2690 domain-containing protein [Streptomyces sp. NBC_00233]|uniref:DUF2690 domain-containing protein n=1 Tax=Streptomyces sp. NBC_00233 TaxID=2975686 RepID=UPI00224EF87C|nr:DUF2690 domain-containing protein [Streptomyces sp. NBC_00233]MCX5225940.1 DUF2690 domain-containing protein [Streptomyces sp. NBC_00233]
MASELLALKKASGLSFAQLSQKTHYAKSSWERWVNGKQFPPRHAVESLAGLCGTPSTQLLELWDRAQADREAGAGPGAEAEGASDSRGGPDDRAEPDAAGEPEADGTPPRRRRSRFLRTAAVLGPVLVVGGALAAYVTLGRGDDSSSPPPSASVKVAGPQTGCKGAACEGRDPKKMNCGADAVTVRTGSIPKDLVIELRYSRACQAAWGRISFAEIGATVVVNNSDGAAQADVVHYDRDVYSPLIAAPDDGSVWVCAALPKDKARSCTGRFIPSQED